MDEQDSTDSAPDAVLSDALSQHLVLLPQNDLTDEV